MSEPAPGADVELVILTLQHTKKSMVSVADPRG